MRAERRADFLDCPKGHRQDNAVNERQLPAQKEAADDGKRSLKNAAGKIADAAGGKAAEIINIRGDARGDVAGAKFAFQHAHIRVGDLMERHRANVQKHVLRNVPDDVIMHRRTRAVDQNHARHEPCRDEHTVYLPRCAKVNGSSPKHRRCHFEQTRQKRDEQNNKEPGKVFFIIGVKPYER